MPAPHSAGLVSVIILNYNGLAHDYLPRCLDSLAGQTYQNLQVIVVDNHSGDGSVARVRRDYPDVTVIENGENLGFCRGNNAGFRAAQGEYVLFANNDTVFWPDAVQRMVESLRFHPEAGMVAPKLLRPRTDLSQAPLIDSAGLGLRKDFTLRDRGFEERDAGQFEQAGYVFAACGAAAFYRREALQSVLYEADELWDEDFYAYYEDGDLAWRLQNRGWRCVYLPGAVVEHHRGGTSPASFFAKPDVFKVHTIKNRYLMLVKNAPGRALLTHLPYLLVREAFIWGYLLLHPRLLRDVVRTLRATLPAARQRRFVRAQVDGT